ncbi:family 16 glycosylhydrolase [Steroidobacter cummioxidans]|uniref:family 16 glycosylhydrolase n=1 Tax=Steroidobacter cummioxidans TaxID=1803913 RepID=UPI000E312DF4|nr:family 16 glycosylhydrolase [Steroidobacter cummioxidans]
MSIIALAAATATACTALLGQPIDPARPYKQTGQFELVKDYTFGRQRPDATVQSRAKLDQEFFYRYIYENGKLDGLKTYWSYHRDYPDGDARSLHVFDDCTLTLKGRIPPGGGLKPRGIESGMLRGKLPITEGMYIEMRAKLPTGIGAWPAFWLNPGVQYPDGKFSELPWPPEIDIFEFFNWQGRPETRVMTGYVQSHKNPERYGPPKDIWTKFKRNEYVPGFDFSADFHVFSLDWVKDKPIWLLDGEPIKQTYYIWSKPVPAHLLVTNQLGMILKGVDVSAMKADEAQWNYVIDYIRVWRRKE